MSRSRRAPLHVTPAGVRGQVDVSFTAIKGYVVDRTLPLTLKLTPVPDVTLPKTDLAASGKDSKAKDQYYVDLAALYQRKRDRMLDILRQAGFRPIVPSGAYYIMSEIGEFAQDDVAFTQFLVKEIGVATVPGSSFFHRPRDGRRFIRFAYPKQDPTLDEVARRLARLPRAVEKLKC